MLREGKGRELHTKPLQQIDQGRWKNPLQWHASKREVTEFQQHIFPHLEIDITFISLFAVKMNHSLFFDLFGHRNQESNPKLHM